MEKNAYKLAAKLIKGAKNIIVFTGAGISAESGIPTFRGKDGLWNKYNPQELATYEAFIKNPKLVWEWYDFRRQLIKKASPNKAHIILAKWEEFLPITIITQNVDELHQRAGSKNIIELHGNIWILKCINENCGYKEKNYEAPLKELPPICPKCHDLLRPGVVWFGEPLPQEALSKAFSLAKKADLCIVIGTSGVVYPAAHIPFVVKENNGKVIEINLEPTPISQIADISFFEKASLALEKINEYI